MNKETDNLKEEARELLPQFHCRYCGRDEEKGSRCNDDVQYLGDEIDIIIDKATKAAKEYYELKLKNEEAAIRVATTLAERRRCVEAVETMVEVAKEKGGIVGDITRDTAKAILTAINNPAIEAGEDSDE